MEGEMKVNEPTVTEEMVRGKTEAWHKPKNGSVFPAKRRFVKQMMWDLVVDRKTVSPPPPEPSKSNKSSCTVHPCSTN